MVHIGTFEDAKAALAVGADGLVHLYVGSTISEEQSKELIALAKKNKSFVIPTMSVLESMAGIKAQDVMNDTGMMAYLTKTQTLPLGAPYGNAEKSQLMVAPKSSVRRYMPLKYLCWPVLMRVIAAPNMGLVCIMNWRS